MRVGSRSRKRKKVRTSRNRVIIDSVGTFIVLSSVSMLTINTVNNVILGISGNNTSDTKYYQGDIEEDIKLAKADIDYKLNKYTKVSVDKNLGFAILVNKENKLSADYVPENMVIPNIRFNGKVSNKYVVEEVAIALEDMFNDAKEEGITLLGVSGYRSYDYQDTLYKNKVKKAGKAYADKYVAVAGASEHQLGLAMDLVSSDYSKLDSGFAYTEAYKWLEENMHDYGFILRYPKGKEDETGYAFEPWHIRYVGVDVACAIKDKGVTLEGYLLDK